MNRNSLLALGILITVYVSFFTLLSFRRHDGLKSYMNDLGNVDQSIYNTIKGRFMVMTNCYSCNSDQINRLGGHANFILLLFVPFYFVLPDPKILLFTQTLLISLGALPLYLLGKRLFKKSTWLPLVGPFIYLINPMVHDVNLYDFHTIAVAMPLIIFAFYFMYVKRYRLFSLFAILVALTNEDMSLIVFMFGLYMVFKQKEWKRGFIVSALSLSYFFLLIQIIMPFFAKGIVINPVAYRYTYLGESVLEIMQTLITKPWIVGTSLLSMDRVVYVIWLFGSAFFLPVLSLEVFFLSLPSLFINLLSENSAMHYPFFFYYSAPILPFLFLATIFSLLKIKKLIPNSLSFVCLGLLLILTLMSIKISPAPYSSRTSIADYSVSEHSRKIFKIKNIIPSDASLSVQNNLGAHLSQREKVYTFPYKARESDYVLVDVNDPYDGFSNIGPDFIFLTQLEFENYYEQILSLFENPDYGVIYFTEDGFLLFKKGYNKDQNESAEQTFFNNFEAIKRRYKKVQIYQ
ncbi:hypothetical protein A2686_03460 [Candidatus Woesebacteria bacterium RIFCSPHIGHO2_01_FULL_38_10]|uniref:DUF2079 domain-containing protein n=1 Tax=Candidatus Woesebacteria bacterium RIFCSPLOWO2_01_FULL_39_10b TaxID=1802517 RepID=A0A1F8BA36_9BACT|nr:MAG: hypothetical protein A2686_03460 [Candidatus Woesebacteria bacterium RIFCSPHIGHO2_01_FULL_38_10]OGM60218.1 MAG: hypothetical protein A2892_04205 [Candidatus Woesebacteria bacterium RIFCSPLOWO2_01_FULL_39_10b]